MIVGLTLLACASALPEAPLETVATGVAIHLPTGPRVTAGSVTLLGSVAHAADVAVKVPGSEPLTITATASTWDLRARSAAFEGDVRVVRGPVTLTCAHLVVTYLDAETVDRVDATGGVTVVQGARRATSERATLTAKTGEIVLTGNPALTDGPNELHGDRVTVFLDDERATCDGGASPCRLTIAGSAIPR